jgi:hypothetical protein
MRGEGGWLEQIVPSLRSLLATALAPIGSKLLRRVSGTSFEVLSLDDLIAPERQPNLLSRLGRFDPVPDSWTQRHPVAPCC